MATPPSTPKRKAATSPNTPRKKVLMTPKTRAVTSALSRMTTTVSSPERRAKQVRRALNFADKSIAQSAKVVRSAMISANIKKVWNQISSNVNTAKSKAKASKNKNTGKK